MARKSPKGMAPGLPSRDELLAFIKDSPIALGKRDIARAYGLSGADKIALKSLLKELENEGVLERGPTRTYHVGGSLPKVAIIKVMRVTSEGEVFGEPEVWEHPDKAPSVRLIERGRRAHLGVDDRCLARLEMTGPDRYRGHVLKKLERKLDKILGIVRKSGRDFYLEVTDKKLRRDFTIPADQLLEAQTGELVLAEPMGRGRSYKSQPVKVVERLGEPFAPKAISLIAIHAKGIPASFSDAALDQAKTSAHQPLGKREDLRHIPFLVIDPTDARDHDDAIWAQPDEDAHNKGGWRIAVAIADVSYFVQPGTALDRDAWERGNSVYFPDRVVPMLPEALSSDACSLLAGTDKAALVCSMTFDAKGVMKSWVFKRAVIRCAANLAYEQAQAAIDGLADAHTRPYTAGLHDLWAAWGALKAARDARGPLELDLPERRVVLDDKGRVVEIAKRARLDAHRVVEDFMIAANVAAGMELIKHKAASVFRVHEEPSREKLISLQEYLATLNIPLALGQVKKPEIFNKVLAQVVGEAFAEQVSEQVLRTQMQAYYHPENLGHFGLALATYAHFTSPIRRYSDLVVHRALVRALKLGDGAMTDEGAANMARTAEHISMTERRAMEAERDTIDRYVAAYLSQRVGDILPGRITGVTRFGLFVTLEDMGGDGLIPMATLGNERFILDQSGHALEGQWTGTRFDIGYRLPVKLVEANPVTGALRFELAEPITGAEGQTPRPVRPYRSQLPRRSGKRRR